MDDFTIGRIGDILAENKQIARMLQYAISAVFIGLAVKLAVKRR